MNAKIEQGLETKKLIIEQALKFFSKQGFAQTRFDYIGLEIGVTSGAMYHHFRTKKHLFEEVVLLCAKRIAEKVVSTSELEKNLLEGICSGCIAFIEEVSSPKYSRIMLEDGISILGWKRWKEIDALHSESTLVEAIAELKVCRDPGLTAKFISGGVNEIALWVANQPNKTQALGSVENKIRKLISSVLSKESP